MRTVALHLIFLLGLGGCSLADTMMGEGDYECTSSFDCSFGAVCHFSNCMSSGGGAGEIFFVLEAPAFSGHPPQADPEGTRTAGPAEFHAIHLTAAVRVRGEVNTSSGSFRTGSLSLRDGRRVPGVSDTSTVHVGPDGFTADLLPGTYEVSFIPDELLAGRPPITWKSVALTQEGQTEFLLTYPEDEDLFFVVGRVLFTSNPEIPLIGALVQGVFTDSDGRQILSSQATTGNDGSYRLAFPEALTTYSLQLSPGLNTFIPETRVPNLLANTAATVDLDLVPAPLSFTVRTLDSAGESVAGTTLYFQGVIQEYASEYASFELAVQSDATGTSQVSLLPGLYTVTAVPPRSSQQSIAQKEICIAGADLENSLCYVSDVGVEDFLPLILPAKSVVQGLVLSHDEKPSAGSRVVIDTTIGGIRLENEGTTQPDGTFTLLVNHNIELELSHRMRVIPPAISALPRAHLPLLVEGIETELVVKLPAPALLVGEVRSNTGLPVENVAISVYSANGEETDAPRLIGVGSSTAHGEFFIPVPATE